jgi:hypothetical protein
MDKLEDYEGQFIKSKNLKAEEIAKMLDVILEYCEIQDNGFVRFKGDYSASLSKKDLIYFVACARFLANRLQVALERSNLIPSTVSSGEIAEMTMIDKNTVQARVSEFKKKNWLSDPSKGVYEATPNGIKDFLSEVQKKKKKK